MFSNPSGSSSFEPDATEVLTGGGGLVIGGRDAGFSGGVIDTAASGINSWVTNIYGDYNYNEYSYVESPCFDFTGISNPSKFKDALTFF